MFQEALDFRGECEALYQLVAPLTDEQLSTPTLFKEWTIDNVIGHLYMWNWAADLTLKDGAAFQEFMNKVLETAGLKSLRVFETGWLGDLKGRALVEAWRKNFLEMSERYGNADPTKRVKWAGPDMSVRDKITARLMETWSHGQAVYDQLGKVRKNEDRVRPIVLLGVKTFGWTYKVRGEKPPGALPRLQLTAPSGAVWHYGEESQSERIEGNAEDFCQVVTQCRNIADTKLKVIGSTAQNWMSKAQCFAGGAEPPPAPGSRRLVSKL